MKSVADKVVLIVCIRNVRGKYQQKTSIMNTGYLWPAGSSMLPAGGITVDRGTDCFILTRSH